MFSLNLTSSARPLNPDFTGGAGMNEQDSKRRTKELALRVIRLVESMPRKQTAEIIGKQLLRSAMSVGANYRAACRGKSMADVLHKMTIVEEEADESLYWMERLIESKVIPEARLADFDVRDK